MSFGVCFTMALIRSLSPNLDRLQKNLLLHIILNLEQLYLVIQLLAVIYINNWFTNRNLRMYLDENLHD